MSGGRKRRTAGGQLSYVELPCRECGEPVKLAPRRYAELQAQGRRPVCRKNNCHRYAGGAGLPVAGDSFGDESRGAIIADSEGARFLATGDAVVMLAQKRAKAGKQGALAGLRARRRRYR